MVVAHPRHHGEHVTELVGILGINPCSGFLVPHEKGQHQRRPLVEIVMVQRRSHAEVVVLRKVGFKHQLCVGVFLCHVILGLSKLVPGIMPGAVQHQGYRGVVVGIESKSVFPLHLIPVGGHGSGIKRVCAVCMMTGTLPAVALISQHPHRQLAYPSWRHISPSVHQVILSDLWHVHKPVVIAVVVGLTVFHMQQCSR